MVNWPLMSMAVSTEVSGSCRNSHEFGYSLNVCLQNNHFILLKGFNVFFFVFFHPQAKLLAEMDEEFGVSNLVEEEFGQKKVSCAVSLITQLPSPRALGINLMMFFTFIGLLISRFTGSDRRAQSGSFYRRKECNTDS